MGIVAVKRLEHRGQRLQLQDSKQSSPISSRSGGQNEVCLNVTVKTHFEKKEALGSGSSTPRNFPSESSPLFANASLRLTAVT